MADRRPNILLFTTDQQRGDHISLSGHPVVRTPNVDRIPFAIRYPAGLRLPSGAFEQVVGLQDVMPTLLEAAGVPLPSSVTGRSALGAVRGEAWREFIHGEHSPCHSADEAMHYLTDGWQKHVWFPKSGGELFFDLVADRQELHDLAQDPRHGECVAAWRERLVKLLAERPDGFSDGERLLRKEHWSPIAAENTLPADR